MMDSVIPLFPGLPGGPELLIVLFVLVLLFGANKIPKLARSTGQAMGEFKRGREEIEEELEEIQNPTAGSETGTETESSGTESSGTESSETTSGSSSSGTGSETDTDTETETQTESK